MFRIMAMRIFGIIFLIVLSISGYGQNQSKIDSLKLLIEKNEGIDKYESLIGLVRLDAKVEDFNGALLAAEEAKKIAYKLGDTVRIVQSGRMIGQLLNKLSRLVDVERILLIVLPIAKRSNLRSDYELILTNLAVAYCHQGRYDRALNLNFQSLILNEEDKDSLGISISNHNIGLVYYRLNNFDKAIVYNERALQIKYKVDSFDLDRLLLNLSLCYAYKEEFAKAKEYLNKARRICKENCSTQFLIESYLAQGIIEFRSGKHEEAEVSFLNSYKLSFDSGDMRYQLENIVYLARIYIKQSKFKLVKSYLDYAEILGENLSLNSVQIEVYKQFSSLYNQTKDYKNATKYQSKYIHLRDSIYSEELTQNLMVVQAEYEQRENKAKIESQNKVLALKEQVITRQNWVTILAGMAVFLLVALVTILYRTNRQKKKTNLILEQKVKERTKDLAQSFEMMGKAYEEQKHFIAKTSNEIKGPLSTLKGLCGLAMKEVQNPDAQEYFKQLDETTINLTGVVNKLSVNNEGGEVKGV